MSPAQRMLGTTTRDMARPSSLACDACRRKHLKCDGVSPVCGRCVLKALACNYTASRRGLGRRQKQDSRTNRNASSIPLPGAAPFSVPDNSPEDALQSQSRQPLAPGAAMPATPYCDLDDADRQRLLGFYYLNFFTAHPFMVPKSFYIAQNYPDYLNLVIYLVGYQYSKEPDHAAGLQDAVSFAMSSADDTTVSRVQALILYAIVLHVCHQPLQAESCIARAAKIALNLGMNEPSFAQSHAADCPVIEESLRRTWWELYTVDIYLAAIHRRSTYQTSSADKLPLLPCSQALYETGQCDPNPPTLQAFEDRLFLMESSSEFSSYCYRIDAIRIVSRALAHAATDQVQSDDIECLDSALVSWEYNLALPQTNLVGPSGEVDLMLFQARCFISCASIFLHFPRSDLPLNVPSANDIACAKGYKQLASASRHHTIKAITASKELSNLATLPWPLDQHSPLFICGLVLSSIVQLAAGSIHFHRCELDCLQQHRDRIVLMLGALRRLGDRWSLAQNALLYLKPVAERVFTSRDDIAAQWSTVNSSHDSAMDLGENISTPFWFDLFSPGDIQNDFFNV